MAKTKQFKIKVRRDAPDTVAHGNFSAEKAGGHYTTDNARFAAWLEEAYGAERPEAEAAPPDAPLTDETEAEIAAADTEDGGKK
ncbi:MAG: hypothetical protein KF831_10375 [Acidobacteria bacterium]|nr:hypothetical protein [Acidobacteriota bacterium]